MRSNSLVVRGKHGQQAVIQPAATGFTFPTLDISAINSAVSGMFAYLSPVLFLVGGISIGGLLLGKAKHLF